MEKIIVYVDDAGYAQQQLCPMAHAGDTPLNRATHWVLVACAPRMTHRISKWVSHSARESWRAKWADKLFGELVPWLEQRGETVTPVLARGPLPELTGRLKAEHGAARVLDARRPKFGQDLQPVTAEQAAAARQEQESKRWQVPGAVAGLGAVLLLAGD
ncbi:hypothetical protein [Xylophilus sp.]|uniref:hypothetical protein n=1 Tax=Xylophilus sp. TaxID=2653893 RepID=UPI0013BC80DB|nr:hypothetical protein [Xylophilus sp.]KAF1046869.1 MAG: hypothetical protein GAK38_02268 [Xylophilus sp.]